MQPNFELTFDLEAYESSCLLCGATEGVSTARIIPPDASDFQYDTNGDYAFLNELPIAISHAGNAIILCPVHLDSFRNFRIALVPHLPDVELLQKHASIALASSNIALALESWGDFRPTKIKDLPLNYQVSISI
ncbi:hypothetical protein BT69DRAFT_1283972 [Atractiella rhizophila]|nr:hypothetical protein BT69DRAFT_1283972 [Atractiella rhizophila]